MRKIIKSLFILYGFFLFQGFIHSSPTIVLEKNVQKYPLGLHLETLEDKTGKLDFEQVRTPEFSNKFMASKKETPNFGITNSVYWVKFSIENHFTNPKEYLLEIAYPPLDYIDIYILNPDGTFVTKKSGDQIPFFKRDLNYHNFLFQIPIEPGKNQTIYLRFQTESSMQLPIVIWRTDALVEHSAEKNYFQGLYYGIMVAMFLYNIFLFFSIKDKSYLYYVLYMGFFSLYQLALNGYAYQYLFPVYPKLANWSHPILIGLSLFFMTFFVRSFLDLKSYNKTLNAIFITFGVISFGVVLSSFFISYQNNIRFLALFVMTSFSVTIASGIFVWRKGYKPARYFLLAWIAYLSGGVLFAVKTFGILPSSFLTNYSVQIGSAIEVILLSLGLADRFKKEREEKQLAQQRAIEAQKQSLENLKKADKLKDEFLANTSHELRTPLNGIIGISESLLDGATGNLSIPTKDNLSLIVASGKRLANLVNDILDFSKLKHKELELNIQPVDIYSLTNLVLLLSKPLVKGKKIKLINQIPAGIPYVLADENRLQQILHNLIGNAIKFTEEGEIIITVVGTDISTTLNVRDTTTLNVRDTTTLNVIGRSMSVVEGSKQPMITISISDTGIGIPNDKLDSIFESFEQVDSSDTRKYGGTGLGLAIAKKLIEIQGGEIRVESNYGNPNHGSKFVFTLPISEEEPNKKYLNEPISKIQEDVLFDEKEVIAESQQKEENSKAYILAIDDEPINLQVISNYLSLQGYLVKTASNGKEALEKIRNKKEKPDLVLLDIMMPHITGFEICQEIRKIYNVSELPIIFLTAKNRISDLLEGFDVGGNDYIAKPFSKTELLSRIGLHTRLSEISSQLGNKIRMEMELRTASAVQSALFPEENPHIPNMDIYAACKTASEIGGDWYGYSIKFENYLYLFIGDVTGHGTPAALVTAAIYSAMRQMEEDFLAYGKIALPSEWNKTLNRRVVDAGNNREYFMTFLTIRIDTITGEMKYSNAAHCYPLLFRDRSVKPLLSGSTTMLGILDEVNLKDQSLFLIEGDILFLYTDGLTEAKNQKREMFGEKGLEDSLLSLSEKSSEDIVNEMFKMLEGFSGRNDFQDDVVMISCKVLHPFVPSYKP
ncbi:MAG: SpoIIE family protein phosphatase [Leptospiraceae bacterium]|nr:SpoIIE family protein phosphatase [Leptospiraceae bacterium]